MNVNNDLEPKNYEFGYLPEVVGFMITISILSFLFGLSEGMF